MGLFRSQLYRLTSTSLLVLSISDLNAPPQHAAAAERKVSEGLTTGRLVPGAPYELAGKRMVFANWHFIQPGDLDWRDADGKSVYVSGNSGPFDARHVGINAPRGIRLAAEKPLLTEPAFRPHRMIIQEGTIYKGWTDSDYYESADGRQWERKGRLELDEPVKSGLYQIFIDPSAPPAERYKAIGTGSISRAQFDEFRKKRPDDWEPRATLLLEEKGEVECLRGSVSPDGIRWTTLPDPLVVEYCDTWNTAYFDAALEEYVIYTRQWSIGSRTDRLPPDIRNSWTGIGRRAIGRTASRDFRRFAPSEMALEPTPDMPPSEQLYTNCRTNVPGAPDQHLMFPTIWNGSVDDTTRIALASSHDGKTWHWVPGGDLLRTASFGRWNGGCIWATPNLVEWPNGDWALPYLAHNLPHKYPRGQLVGETAWAIWPKGRLCSVIADDHGEFTLVTVMAPGKFLKINAVTLRTGWIKIEVLGVKERGLADCRPIIGDQHWSRVSWNAGDDLGIKPGDPVTLRLELQRAQIFGLEFE